MRLIDADKLKEEIGECPENWLDSPEEMQAVDDWNGFMNVIDAQPTVEATSIRIGHWVDQGKDLEAHSMEVLDAWSCSRCRYYIHGNGYPKWKYCPMCGCRMKWENE